MAAKAERKKRFFSLSRSIRYNSPAQHYQQQEQHVTLCERRREHISRVLAPNSRAKRSFVLDFFECKERERERESAFVFPLLELRRDKVNRAKRERNKIFLERTKKLRRENNELWWPTTASASVVPGAQRVRVSAHIFRSRVSFVSETFSRSREVCVLRFRILVIILSLSSA